MTDKYHIPRERRLELLHYCRQYYDISSELLLAQMASLQPTTSTSVVVKKYENDNVAWSDPVGEQAAKIAQLKARLEPIHQALQKCDPQLEYYILEHVGMGCSYDDLVKKYAPTVIPATIEQFYDEVKHFFWELSKIRN